MRQWDIITGKKLLVAYNKLSSMYGFVGILLLAPLAVGNALVTHRTFVVGMVDITRWPSQTMVKYCIVQVVARYSSSLRIRGKSLQSFRAITAM